MGLSRIQRYCRVTQSSQLLGDLEEDVSSDRGAGDEQGVIELLAFLGNGGLSCNIAARQGFSRSLKSHRTTGVMYFHQSSAQP